MALNIEKFIDFLTTLVFASLFLISSTGINGQIISNITACLAFVICILGSLNKDGFIKIDKMFFFWMVMFLGYCFLSMLWAINPLFPYAKGISIAKNGICILFVQSYYIEHKSIKCLLKICMHGGYIVAIFAYLFYGLNTIRYFVQNTERITNELINANTIGMLCASTLLINLYFFLYYKEGVIYLPLFLLTFVLLGVSGSRKGIIEIVIGAMMLVFFYCTGKGKVSFKLLFGMIILAIVMYALSSLAVFNYVNARFINVINYFTGSGYTDLSIRSRVKMIELGVQLFLKKPVVGIGIDCGRIPLMQFFGRNWYLHNNYVELLVDGGIVGLMIYLSIFIILLRRFWIYRECRDYEYDMCLILLIVHLVLTFGYVSYYNRETYFYLMIFLLETEILKKRFEDNTIS